MSVWPSQNKWLNEVVEERYDGSILLNSCKEPCINNTKGMKKINDIKFQKIKTNKVVVIQCKTDINYNPNKSRTT